MIILQETEYNKQIVEKEEEYMEYIKDHINNVHKAFENMYDQYGKFIRPNSSVCVTIDGKVKKGYIKLFRQ